MLESENSPKKSLVIAVPSHGAYDLAGQFPTPSPKSIDRVNAAFVQYNESVNSGNYESVSVVFIGGWRGENNPSTAELMSTEFQKLFDTDEENIVNKSISTFVLGNSKETRRNITDLHDYLISRSDPNTTEVKIVSQKYHNAFGRLDRLSKSLLGDFADNTNFVSVEELEETYPESLARKAEVDRSPTLAEMVHILVIQAGRLLDIATGNDFKYEEFVYNDIDLLRQKKFALNVLVGRFLGLPK